MKNDEKLIVLISKEEDLLLRDFLINSNFILHSEFDIKNFDQYAFIVGDYLPGLRNIPRINSKINKDESFFDFSGEFDSTFLNSPQVDNLLKSYFDFKSKFNLFEIYTSQFQNYLNFKIYDYLNIGQFIDKITACSYKENFDFIKVRNYLNISIPFLLKTTLDRLGQLYVNVSYSYSKESFAIILEVNVPNEDLGKNDFFELTNLLKTNSNFVSINKNSPRKLITISSLWFNDVTLKDFKSYFFTESNIIKKSKIEKLKNIILEKNEKIIFKASKLNQYDNVLIVKGKREGNESSNFQVKFSNNPVPNLENIVVRRNDEELENLKSQNAKYKKAINIMKFDLLQFNNKIKNNLENAALEKEKLEKVISEKDNMIINLNSKILDLQKNSSQKILDPIENNNELENANLVIKKLKIEKFEMRKKYDLLLDLHQKTKNLPNQKEIGPSNTEVKNETVHESKALDESNRLLKAELKKSQHKLKLALGQLEEAQKSSRTTQVNKGNEIHQKQLENMTERINELNAEISLKRKELIKLKKDNSDFKKLIEDLEKKLLITEKLNLSDKKAA